MEGVALAPVAAEMTS